MFAAFQWVGREDSKYTQWAGCETLGISKLSGIGLSSFTVCSCSSFFHSWYINHFLKSIATSIQKIKEIQNYPKHYLPLAMQHNLSGAIASKEIFFCDYVNSAKYQFTFWRNSMKRNHCNKTFESMWSLAGQLFYVGTLEWWESCTFLPCFGDFDCPLPINRYKFTVALFNPF